MKYFIAFLLSFSCLPSVRAQQSQLDTLFNQLEKDLSFNGCIAIAEGNQLLYSRAVGLADFKTGERLNDSSIFELASVSKTFIGVAIQQLKDKGLLRYTDSLRQFFPEMPYPGVQITHLLEHTSGIGDFLYLRDFPLDTTKINTNADIVKILPAAFPVPAFIPGQTNAYSNSNYLLLAAIVEQVSGMPLNDYLRKHIFEPAGMTRTFVHHRLTGKPLSGYAKGYSWSTITNQYDEPENRPSGRFMHYMDGVTGPFGISSTTGDMIRFHAALQSSLLVSAATLTDAYEKGKLLNGTSIVFGKGWQIKDDSASNENKMVYHTGSYSGYRNMFIRYPEKDRVVILLSNFGYRDVFLLKESIDHIISGEPFSAPKYRKPGPANINRLGDSTMQQYCGKYQIASITLSVTQEGEVLICKQRGRTEFELHVQARDVFYMADLPGFQYSFVRDSNGKVHKLEIKSRMGIQTAVKVQ